MQSSHNLGGYSFEAWFLNAERHPTTQMNARRRCELYSLKGATDMSTKAQVLCVHALELLVPKFLSRFRYARVREHKCCQEVLFVAARCVVAGKASGHCFQVAGPRPWEEGLGWDVIGCDAHGDTTVNAGLDRFDHESMMANDVSNRMPREAASLRTVERNSVLAYSAVGGIVFGALR